MKAWWKRQCNEYYTGNGKHPQLAFRSVVTFGKLLIGEVVLRASVTVSSSALVRSV